MKESNQQTGIKGITTQRRGGSKLKNSDCNLGFYKFPPGHDFSSLFLTPQLLIGFLSFLLLSPTKEGGGDYMHRRRRDSSGTHWDATSKRGGQRFQRYLTVKWQVDLAISLCHTKHLRA